jgi:hypothetical protein
VSQEQWIILGLKIGVTSGFASLVAWVGVYTWLTRGAAWRNPVGLTLMLKSLLLAALFVPAGLSLFLHLNRFDSLVSGWADVGLVGAVTPVMLWRTAVWLQMARLGSLPPGHGGEER